MIATTGEIHDSHEGHSGKVIRERTDGRTLVRLDSTGQRILAVRLNGGERYPVGATVKVFKDKATVSGDWVVAGSPVIYRDSNPAVTTVGEDTGFHITKIQVKNVDEAAFHAKPLYLCAGMPGTIEIYGFGLTSAPTYDNANITNASAPVINATKTKITLQVEANELAPPLPVGMSWALSSPTRTKRINEAIVIQNCVYVPPVPEIIPSVWFSSYRSDPPLGYLTQVRVSDAVVIQSTALQFDAGGYSQPILVRVGDNLISTSNGKTEIVDLATGDVTTPSGWPVTDPNQSGILSATYDATDGLWLTTGSDLLRINPATGATLDTVDLSAHEWACVLHADGFLWVGVVDPNRIYRIDPDAIDLDDYIDLGPTINDRAPATLVDGPVGFIYVRLGGTGIGRVATANLDLAHEYSPAGSDAAAPLGYLDGFVYAVIGVAGAYTLRKLDADDLTEVDSVSLSGSHAGFGTMTNDGSTLWMASGYEVIQFDTDLNILDRLTPVDTDQDYDDIIFIS